MIALAVFHARTILRGRSSIAAIVGFALAAGVVALIGLESFQALGFGSVGPAAVGFLNLALLLPTAQAMLVGALTITADRESGILAMVRARGTGTVAVALGAWFAVAGAAWAALAAGFGLAALLLSGTVPIAELPAFTAILGVSLVVSAAAAAIGVLLGAIVRTRLQAALVAIVVWFVLAIGLDLLVVGLGVFLRAGEPALITSILIDPIAAGRVLALIALDASGTALGTLGTYLVGRFGAAGAAGLLSAVLLAWAILPAIAAGWWLSRRDP